MGPSLIRTKPPLRPATDLMPVLGRKHALGAAGGAGYLTRPVGMPKARALVNSQQHAPVSRPTAQPVYNPPRPVPSPSPARPATSQPSTSQADQQQQSLLRFNHGVLLAASRFYAEVAGIVVSCAYDMDLISSPVLPHRSCTKLWRPRLVGARVESWECSVKQKMYARAWYVQRLLEFDGSDCRRG